MASRQAPDEIPGKIRDFLSAATDMPLDFVDGCWKAFANLIWEYDDGKTKGADAEAFKKHGLDHLFCNGLVTVLRVLPPYSSVQYTLSDGACATFANHLSCSECKARYYPNYMVRNGIRNYYEHIPKDIQVCEHQYVERTVLNLFINLMLISLRQPDDIPEHLDWADKSFQLRPEHVWDGFIITTLLEDYTARGEILRVPHTGDQRDRFTQAMEERNARIQLRGQPEWGHYCTRSLRVWDDGRKSMSLLSTELPSGIHAAVSCTAQYLSPITDTDSARTMPLDIKFALLRVVRPPRRIRYSTQRRCTRSAAFGFSVQTGQSEVDPTSKHCCRNHPAAMTIRISAYARTCKLY
ncbi:hypothetical protein B0H16DRAFT_1891141 [Mycena metata]|uniref:CxC5 like cysteine cluster associated with KDZ domain-containing protein n=1 Tax=Mycena metata TaxID=1033252 RepID=A0AAD7IB92_9AGAR|nr:hypothetical protein B0H16DRAFT_1891141 [Mycena metata]